MNAISPPLLITPLDALHRRLGARMVGFAGYDMPVHFPMGVMAEHLHTRAQAGLFDVSHMGQATLSGPGAAEFLETLLPGEIVGLKPGHQRYGFFTTSDCGISDDLMVSRLADDVFFLVVNASRKAQDFAHIRAHLPSGLTLRVHADRALLALQGPDAAAMLPMLDDMRFMTVREAVLHGVPCLVARSGYTGEDGFEISCPAAEAEGLAAELLQDPRCAPIGLGARDSLRLEAGLCLYGNDIDLATNPVEAGLVWAIGKRRRMQGGFPGAARFAEIFGQGPTRRRIGILPAGRAPARAGTAVMSADGAPIGAITSGGYSPSLGVPIAMGYVDAGHAADGSELLLRVRDRNLPARVAPMPFVPHRYRK